MKSFKNLIIIILVGGLVFCLVIINSQSNVDVNEVVSKIYELEQLNLTDEEWTISTNITSFLQEYDLTTTAQQKLMKITQYNNFMYYKAKEDTNTIIHWNEVSEMIASNIAFDKHALRVLMTLEGGTHVDKKPMMGYEIDMEVLKRLIFEPDSKKNQLRDISGLYILPATNYCQRNESGNDFKYRTMVIGTLDQDGMLMTGDEDPFADFFKPCPFDCQGVFQPKHIKDIDNKIAKLGRLTKFPSFKGYVLVNPPVCEE